MKSVKSVRSVKAGYDQQNLEAARIIAGDPVRYPGGAQEWAALVLKRLTQPTDAEVGPLFESRAA